MDVQRFVVPYAWQPSNFNCRSRRGRWRSGIRALQHIDQALALASRSFSVDGWTVWLKTAAAPEADCAEEKAACWRTATSCSYRACGILPYSGPLTAIYVHSAKFPRKAASGGSVPNIQCGNWHAGDSSSAFRHFFSAVPLLSVQHASSESLA